MLNLKIARIKKGLNQIELAGLIDIPVRTLRSYESGQAKPPIDKLCKIADVLNVSTDFLLEREVK